MQDLLNSAHRGVFMVLVGPDGSGKTSVAGAIADQLGDRAGYFHFRPDRGKGLASRPNMGAPPQPKAIRAGPMIFGWMRLVLNLFRFWIGYLSVVRPAVRRGVNVIGDVWAYRYLTQPLAMRYAGPDWLAHQMLRLFPQPDLVINLNAPPEVIEARKGELALNEISKELALWPTIPCRCLVTLDAVDSPPRIAAEVIAKAGLR